MNHEDNIVCSICGAEHDEESSPELGSTHLCPDCAAKQRRATRAPQCSGEQEEERAAE